MSILIDFKNEETMITVVSKRDFFGIKQSFTSEEIWLKYGKLVINEVSKPNKKAIRKLKGK